MSKKIVLITGCSDGGLGAALALAFHKKNYRVIATARNVTKMANLKNNGIETVSLDVLSAESIKAAVAEVTKLTDGKLDILVNNAGAGYSMPVADIELKEIRDLFELNVFSVIAVTQAFLPLVRKARGIIANNTSIAGTPHGGIPIQAAYNSSKAALSSITSSMRLELEPFGVKVVDLKTGAVKTNFFSNVVGHPLPEGSIYTPAKKEIEAFMQGGELMKDAMTADQWASRVVKDLSGKPPYQVWRGTQSTLLWAISIFPVWIIDSMVKDLVGLKALEQRLKSTKA